uniref:7TM_GPCR_Srx domain-containing protein n=1 Tax=Strongyloides venezuelensis TaxID=75913 RepID=A0A0K0F4C7_STRVS
MDHEYDDSIIAGFSEEEKTINRLIGFVYLITSITSMIVQVIIFLAFLKNPQILKNTSYKIMLHIGCCNFVQQISFFLTSFSIIFIYYDSPLWIDSIGGALCQATFLMTVFFIVLLTLNCFDIFYQQKFFPSINRNNFFMKGIIGCYIWGILIFSLYMLPPFSMEFSHLEIGYNFKIQSAIYNYAWEFENKVVIGFLTFSFFIYIFIVVKIHRLKQHQNNSFRSTFSLRDINFLLQAILNFIIYVFIELLWEFADDILPDNRYIFITINYFFALTFSSNTILCVIIISEVKDMIKKMFCRLGKEKVSRVMNKINV